MNLQSRSPLQFTQLLTLQCSSISYLPTNNPNTPWIFPFPFNPAVRICREYLLFNSPNPTLSSSMPQLLPLQCSSISYLPTNNLNTPFCAKPLSLSLSHIVISSSTLAVIGEELYLIGKTAIFSYCFYTVLHFLYFPI